MEQELVGEKEDQTECFTCEFTADDADNVALRFSQIYKQMSLEQELAGEKEDQTELFTADDADNVTLQTPQKTKHRSLGKETVCVKTEMRRCKAIHYFFHQPHKSCTIALRKHQKILKHYIQQRVLEKQERIYLRRLITFYNMI